MTHVDGYSQVEFDATTQGWSASATAAYGGTTDVAVISLAGIVFSRSVRIAGNEMDDAIIQYLKRKYNLLIGERTAEDIKIAIGSAYPGPHDKQHVSMRGRDLLTGLPRFVEITAEQVREAIDASLAQIVSTIKDAIEETPAMRRVLDRELGVAAAPGDVRAPGGELDLGRARVSPPLICWRSSTSGSMPRARAVSRASGCCSTTTSTSSKEAAAMPTFGPPSTRA